MSHFASNDWNGLFKFVHTFSLVSKICLSTHSILIVVYMETSPLNGSAWVSVARLGRLKSWSWIAMRSRDSDFRNARIDSIITFNVLTETAIGTFVLYYREVEGAKFTCLRVHALVKLQHIVSHTHTLSHKWTLHLPPPCYTILQYSMKLPIAVKFFGWKLNAESRLIVGVATFEWRPVDSPKIWSRATLAWVPCYMYMWLLLMESPDPGLRYSQ